MQSGDLAPPTVVYEIGQHQLLALRESGADDTVKVLNLRKLFAGLVEGEGAAKPYLLSMRSSKRPSTPKPDAVT